ncbi:MAG: D-tyrosyl-tRNA(Tyr) deacylase [Planctomycetes bacterium]|nr:D-tyrosyl-tRNA(Tyr) deacylase [Planctomycetota bacterium]
MKVLLQRVSRAQVRVDGGVVGSIDAGLLLLVGIGQGDGAEQLERMAHKVANLRVFADADGKMNRSVLDTGGGVLAVSQFTLYADSSKGNRPSYIDAAPPEQARNLYEQFCARLEAKLAKPVARGVFGAHMDVELVNDGPVTLMLEY